MSAASAAPLLEAVPNLASAGGPAIEAAQRRLRDPGCELLDLHSDGDHQRTVLTVLGQPQVLAEALIALAGDAVAGIDLTNYSGVHPCVGALDVLPVVYLTEADRPSARDTALGVANRIAAQLELPVFLYGELASSEERRERAYFRGGGLAELGERMQNNELVPDFGPSVLHPSAGATLVAARPPLVAFNVDLDGASLELARTIAAELREAGGGLPGVRAIGLELAGQQRVQVSTNVHDPLAVPLRELLGAIESRALAAGARLAGAELVGLAPAAALEGLDLELLRDFDPSRDVLENRIEDV